MNADQKGAWLELKELHSSLNDLKDKLNRTGQKLSAASSSGPIEFNFTARPSSGGPTSISNFAYSSRTAATSTSPLVRPRKSRPIAQSPGSSAINGLSSPQAHSTEESHISLQPSSIKNVAFLHHDEFDFMRSLRQSSARSSFVPSAAAITTAANVTFTVGGFVTKHNASNSGLHVRKAHYINDEAGRLLKQGPRYSGSKALSGSSRKLRRLVEKQKNVAEHRHRKAKSPQRQADRNGNHIDVHASQVAARRQSTKLVDASTCCRPSSTTIATNTSTTMAVGFSEPSEKQHLEDENTLRRNRAFSEVVENVSLCSQDYVEEYLEYLKKRKTVGHDAMEPLPCTASTLLENGPYRHENLPEDEHISLASTGVFIDPVWKRKFASLPQPKEYRGFSLQADASTRKKVRQLSSKMHKPEGAGELPFTAVEKNKPNAQFTGAIQHGCHETEEKTSAGAHPVKPSATGMQAAQTTAETNGKTQAPIMDQQHIITPTSWKKGRNLALKIHGPYPPASLVKAATVSEKQSGNGSTKTRAQVEQLRSTGANGEKYIVPIEDRILALRNLKKSRSVKRKAQHHMEPEGNSPAPATKVRHYDAPAVRDFIMKQKLGRKQEKHKAEQSTVDAARTRELRLEKLYAFQRKTACDSARIGRCKMSRQQEDEKLVHEFVRHLKSMQDVTDFDQVDNSPQRLAPGSNVGVAERGHDSCQLHMQLQRDQEVQAVKASTDTTSVGHGGKDKCPLRHSADHSNLSSNHSQHDENDVLVKLLEGQLATAHYDFGTSSLVDCEKQGLQKQEFQYEPTEQVLRLERITTGINETLDEQLQLLSCNTAFQGPEYGEHHASGITQRLQTMLSKVHGTSCGPTQAHDSVGWSMPFEETSDKAPSIPVPARVQNEPARKIQNFFCKHLVQNREGMLEKDDDKYEKHGVNALSCIFEESAQPQRESSPRGSTTSAELSAPDEESSHHLMPDPNTIARAWKNKFAKAFLTSTRLGDELSLPSINLSTVATSGALTPGKVLAHQTQSEDLQEKVQTSRGTSAEDLTSLLEKEAAQHSSIAACHTSVTKSFLTSEAATEKMGVLPVKPASTETDSRPSTKSLLNPQKALKKASRQNLEQQQPSENTETSLVSLIGSKIASRHLSGFERPQPKQASLNNDKAWVLLEAQAKALQASAETARHLAQIRAPSLLELHGENMVQRLTASTVAAASALAAALASQRPDWQVSIASDKSAHRRTQASSSSSTASQPTDAGFESIDKTSSQSSAEESGSPPTEDNSKKVQEAQAKSQRDDDNVGVGGSDRSASSASISEELDTLGLSDSSQNNKISKSNTSKKRQPKNVVPLSLDSSATEDSAGASNPQQAWSQSSLSETVLLDRDLCSYGSLMEHPLGGRSSSKEEIEGGGQPPLALLRLQERDLIERARAELTWIEVLKRNCREKGSEEKLPALRKRQRAILIKLHQKRIELKALQSRCLTQSHEAASHASVSNETSVPMYNASGVPDGSTSGMHSSGISENREASLLSDQLSDQSKESSQPEEIPSKVEQKSSLVNSYISTFESSSTFPELQEDSTHLKLNASKRFLEKRQQKLQDRRKNVQQLLEWQRKLNAQEASVRALERRALARLRARGAKTPPQSKSDTSVTAAPAQAEMTTSRSRSGGEVKSSTYPEDSSIEEEVSEEVDVKVTPTTESIQEEAAGTEQTSGGQHESTVDSKVVASASSEAEVSTQTENVIRRSSSSGPKSLMLMKKPLVVRRKIRRDSSGSEDSFNVSLSETASDQSDIECRIIALSQELKKRQLEAEQLKREQRRRRTEVLREREESLKKHIELYDKLIQQAKEELEKELDIAQHEKAPFVKPQIKKPRAAEQRKHRLVQLGSSESVTQPASALQSKESKSCTESAGEVLTGSSKKSESEIGTEEDQSNEASSFVSSGAEELTPKLATPSVTDKSDSRTSASSASSEIVEELSSKEVSVSASKRDSEQPEATSSYASSKAAEEPSSISEIQPDAEDPSFISARATNEPLAQDNTSVCGRTSEPDIYADASVKSSTDPTFQAQHATDKDKISLSNDDVSERNSATASESLLHEGGVEDKVNSTEQPAKEANLPAMDKSEFENDAISEGILPSLSDNETSLSHEVKDLVNQSPDEQPYDEVAQAFEKHPCEKPLSHAENLSEVNVLKEASSPASSKTADAPASLSSLEDESAVTEEVAEYTEEIVHSIVIDSSLSHEEAIEEGKVDKAVNSILCYLLEDTIKALVERKDSSIPFAKESVTVKAAMSNGIAKKTLIPDVPASREYFTASLNEEVLSATERSTDDHYVQVTRRATLAGAAEGKIAETSEQFDSSLQADQPWATDVINVIAEVLVSEAIESVVGIAKEKGLLTAMSVESDSHKSNVSQKVSAILATIEETRNSREYQRPQDLMVLSTDLDDEEFSWKDASTTPILTLSEDAPAEMGPKELCSRAVQAEDCFLSPTSEQDWFDDDFGLGRSGDNALAYQRRIPNKPPPPYSPPKSGFMSRLFSEAVWKVPNLEAEVFALVQKAAASIYTTAVQGKGLANLTFSPECVSEKAGASAIDRDSYRAYCEFLFDLVKETAQEIFCTEATDTSPPPWQRNVRLRRKQPLPATLESFISIVGSKVMSVPGLHENSELAFRNFDDQGLNFVNILLSSEARGEEPEWVDYSREEVIVKDQVANAIFHLLVDDTLETLKSLWQIR